MNTYPEFSRRSIEQPASFWAEQASLIEWQRPFETVCDYETPPFARWFVGGTTNLCHNAVDRHLPDRVDETALIWVSTETGHEQTYSFGDLHAEVQAIAAVILSLGVKRGDRVLVYMPMIPQAVFAMLACARIGAVHSVVFGGFASSSLATRIDDAKPALIVSADAGCRAGKVIPYKPLLDEALELASSKPSKVLIVDRGLAPAIMRADRDESYFASDGRVSCGRWPRASSTSTQDASSGSCASWRRGDRSTPSIGRAQRADDGSLLTACWT